MDEQIHEYNDDLIDIDECLRQIEADPTITVMVGKRGVVVRIDPRKQLRLVQHYVDRKLEVDDQTLERIIRLNTEKQGQINEKDFEDFGGTFHVGGKEDYYGLGLALADYIEDWIGFKGRFDRKKLRKWMEYFSDFTTAFGRNFQQYLSEYQKQRIVYQEKIEGN